MQPKLIPRIERDYDGANPTGRGVSKLLSILIADITATHQKQLTQVVEAFQEMLQTEYKDYATVYSFIDGVVLVIVKNAMVLSILNRLLAKYKTDLQQKFPDFKIDSIKLKLG